MRTKLVELYCVEFSTVRGALSSCLAAITPLYLPPHIPHNARNSRGVWRMRGMTPDDLYDIHWLGEADISPDGERVALAVTKFDRDTDGYRSAIWVVETSGAEPRQFTAGAKRDNSPRWSPDGRRLAFLSERGEDKPQLAIMPADGGESRLLTKLPLGAGVPAWSPDGSKIAFSAKTGEAPEPDQKKA